MSLRSLAGVTPSIAPTETKSSSSSMLSSLAESSSSSGSHGGQKRKSRELRTTTHKAKNLIGAKKREFLYEDKKHDVFELEPNSGESWVGINKLFEIVLGTVKITSENKKQAEKFIRALKTRTCFKYFQTLEGEEAYLLINNDLIEVISSQGTSTSFALADSFRTFLYPPLVTPVASASGSTLSPSATGTVHALGVSGTTFVPPPPRALPDLPSLPSLPPTSQAPTLMPLPTASSHSDELERALRLHQRPTDVLGLDEKVLVEAKKLAERHAEIQKQVQLSYAQIQKQVQGTVAHYPVSGYLQTLYPHFVYVTFPPLGEKAPSAPAPTLFAGGGGGGGGGQSSSSSRVEPLKEGSLNATFKF